MKKDKIPNAITRKTFEDTDQGKKLIRCKNVEDFFRRLKLSEPRKSRKKSPPQLTHTQSVELFQASPLIDLPRQFDFTPG
ncbi:hypothetical protein ACFL35_19345 [Candidatus Riflebacteria bacterium]